MVSTTRLAAFVLSRFPYKSHVQVSLETQTLHLAARTDMIGSLGATCFSPCSQYLLLPWEAYDEPFCLDVVPCPGGVPGERVRLTDAAFGDLEGFACLADGVAITQPGGLLVYGWQGEQVQTLQFDHTADSVELKRPLLASSPGHSLLAALLACSGEVLVYETQHWQLQSRLRLEQQPQSDVWGFLLALEAGLILSSSWVSSERCTQLLLLQQSRDSASQTLVGTLSQPALSQDGRWLASRHDSCVSVHSAATGPLHFQHQLPAAEPHTLHTALAWTPELALVLGSCIDSEEGQDRMRVFQF